MHQPRVAEQCDGKFPVVSDIPPTGQNLVDQVIDNAMQKVVPREIEEKILDGETRQLSALGDLH